MKLKHSPLLAIRKENIYQITVDMPPIDHTGEFVEQVNVAARSITDAMSLYQQIYPDYVEAGTVTNVSLLAEDVRMLS